jgi:D-arginine dehydrogenase
MASFDFIIVGAGIAGASAAYELQQYGSAVLLEREPLPGQHTTGRSAAFLVDSYGGPVVSKFTRAGRSFFEEPPDGFTDFPLVTPNSLLWIGRGDQRRSLDDAITKGRAAGADLYEVTVSEALEICPVLCADYVQAAVAEPSAMHIDVAGLLDGFLRGFRRRGGHLETKAEVHRIEKTGESWSVDAGGQNYTAPIVVNAAGAWSDAVGRLAGACSIGLRPLRRTVITFDAPENVDPRGWPVVIDADEDFYFKPEGGRLLASPCDETPSTPCDASPEDYDVALAADSVQRCTTLDITHIRSRWAGLRSFVEDRSLVLGMDPEQTGFFWLAGQGGFGIMTAPAAARATARMIVEGSLPSDLLDLGVTREALSVERLSRPNEPRPTLHEMRP